MHDLQEESTALLGEHALEHEDEKARRPTQFQPLFNVPRWLLFTCCVLATLDIVVYISVAQLLRSKSDLSDSSTLPVRNQYIGLHELYQSQPALVNALSYDPIVNRPRIAAQVSSSQPYKVTPQGEHRHLTNIGMLFPPEHHLQVSRETHTVLQFRTMDFGMERCALALRLPDLGESQADASSTSANTTILDLCALDNKGMLNEREISWAIRPGCYRHVGTLDARPGGEVQLPEFPCPWGSLHTYKIACASDTPDCSVDVWSNQRDPWGMFMYQFQTI